MSRFVVIDQDSYEPAEGTVLNTLDIVDRDGYRDTKTMVMEFINAGERLQQFRRDEFDYERDNPDFEINPTNVNGFDVIDAERILELEGKRLARLKKDREEAAEKAAAAEAAAKAANNVST